MSHDKDWPAHYYGPNGESRVFHRAEDVPAGWLDHPSKHVTAEKTGSRPLPPQTDKVPAAQRGSKPVHAKNNATASKSGGAATKGQTSDVSNTLDRDGHAWDPNLHAATKSLTKDGLWRMRVGVSRPAPKPGFPMAPLDL